MYLIEQKFCNLLWLRKVPRMETKVGDGNCKKEPLPNLIGKNEREKIVFQKLKSRGN